MMNEHPEARDREAASRTDETRAPRAEIRAVTPQELAQVRGGFNPQPEPPRYLSLPSIRFQWF